MVNKKGFTLIELVIVISIIVILTSIVVPNFISTTEHSKLKTDIQTAVIVHNAIELYRMQNGDLPSEVNNISSLATLLRENNYINNMELVPQLIGAEWEYDATSGKILLNIAECSESIKRLAESLTAQERQYIVI